MSGRGLHTLTVACLLAAGFAGWSGRACADVESGSRYVFDLPRQTLDASLQSVALLTGFRLLYSAELVAGLVAPPMKGAYPVELALEELLQRSGLTYEISSAKTIFIRRVESSGIRDGVASPRPGQRPGGSVEVASGRRSRSASEVGEIFVTARRRMENAQTLPLTISSFEWPILDFGYSGISNIQDLGFLVPNVSIRGGGTTAGTSMGDFRIRGVPGVARYMDGIYLRSMRGALQSVVELERVEILRGPQGTLFGKDAIGGAIQYVSRPPAREFGARVNVTGGTDDRLDIVANVDVPLRDTLFTKLMVARLKTGGYVDSVTADRTYGGSEERQVRGSLRWEPSESLEVNVSAHYADITDDGDPQVLFDVTPQIVNGLPNDPWLYNHVDENILDIGTPIRKEHLPGKWKTRSNQGWPSFEHETEMVSASLRWTMARNMEARWLSGFRDFNGYHYGDTDATEYHVFESWRPAKGRETSNEIQFSYQGDRLQWLLGLYNADADATTGNWRFQNVELNDPLIADVLREQFADRVLSASRSSQNRIRDESRAVFGEASLRLGDGWVWSYGVRYSSDTVRQFVEVPCEARLLVGQFPEDPFCKVAALVDRSQKFTRTTPRASVAYEWTPRVMGYLSWSQGFDKGGINTTLDRRTPPQLPNDGLFAYGPQVLTNYELGLRAELLEGRFRFNATAFYGEWDKIQVMEELIPGQPGRWTSNAGAARIQGIELDLAGRIGGALDLTAGVGFLSTRYTALGNTRHLTLDTPFPFSPEASFNIGAAYSRAVSGAGSVEVRTGYTWQDRLWTNQDDESSIELPALGQVSASLTFTAEDGGWGLSLTGTNLTNEYYRLSGFRLPVSTFDFGTVAPPRQYSLTVRLSTR